MPNETDYKLKFQITADAKGAQAELKNVDAAIKKLSGGSAAELQRGFKGASNELSSLVGIFTGDRLSGATSQLTSFSTAVGAIPGAAGLAAGAIAGLGVAAVTAGTALFEMTKEAAEAVKTIGSFSFITGLSVEQTSALRYALNFMHKDLTDIQPAMVFFARQMDAAAGGSDKATAALKRLGVTQFTDLNAALDTSFRKLDGATNETEKLGAAAAAFGRRGAIDMIKVAHTVGGEFEDWTKKAQELGVTLSEDDVNAAKEFSHTYEKVMFQATVATEKFALTYADDISSAMQTVSSVLANNKDTWAEWGHSVIFVVRGIEVTFEQLPAVIGGALAQVTGFLGVNNAAIASWAARAIADMNPVVALWNSLRQIGVAAGDAVGRDVSKPISSSPGALPAIPKLPKAPKAARAPKDTSERDAEREAERLEREAEQREKERVAAARQLFHDETAFFEAEAEKRYSIAAQYADQEGKTENDLAKFKEFLDSEVLRVRKERLDEYIAALVGGTKEMERALQEKRILEQQIEKDAADHAVNQQQRDKKTLEDEKKVHDERRKHWKEYQDFIHEQMDLEDQERDRRAKEEADARIKAGVDNSVLGGHGIGAGIGKGLGVVLPSILDDNGRLKSQAQVIKDIYADMSDFAGQAIGSMIDGLAQLGVQFILTGQFSAKAALGMLASTAMQIATTSLMKGIFELAEAAAAAARYDFASAALHKVASGIYFKTAAIAAAFGVGFALAGRAAGGGASGGAAGGGTSNAGQANAVNQNPDPYQRASQNAYLSGRRPDEHIAALTKAIDRLHQKIDTAKPGDVLMRGIAQKPGAIGNATVNDIKRNSGIGRTMRQVSGSG